MSGPTPTEQYLNKWTEVKASYNTRDLILYSLGIGCNEPQFVYENHEDFQPFPTYPIALSFKGTAQSVVSFPSPAMAEAPEMPPLEGIKVGLDGERYIEKVGELDMEEDGEGEEGNGKVNVTLKSRLIGIHKRGSGASVETETQVLNSNGDLVYRIVSGAFLVGAKNFKDSGLSNSEKVPAPDREPDFIVDIPTTEATPALYRLSGDYNPLHIDENSAPMMGFPKPIVHGLCSLGITVRAVLKQFADNDGKMFKAIKCRFAKPVFPGQTLSVCMWKDGDRIVVNTKVKETGQVAINNAYVMLTPKARL